MDLTEDLQGVRFVPDPGKPSQDPEFVALDVDDREIEISTVLAYPRVLVDSLSNDGRVFILVQRQVPL